MLEVWWDLYWYLCYKYPRECANEIIFKIGQHSVKVQTRVWSPFLLTHSVLSTLYY